MKIRRNVLICVAGLYGLAACKHEPEFIIMFYGLLLPSMKAEKKILSLAVGIMVNSSCFLSSSGGRFKTLDVSFKMIFSTVFFLNLHKLFLSSLI